jgi:hypothetical protein
MKAHQHLELLQPVGKVTVSGTTYTTSFSIPRQAGSLVVLGVNRPVTGRNGLVEIEGEDYDGQSGATKQDSGDATLGQSITAGSGGYVFFDNVDFSDAGVSTAQLRVNAQSATTLMLRADSQTGTLLGTCQVAATGGSWATQTCPLTQTTGVHTLYVVFGGTARLNYIKFQQPSSTTGTGGMGGGAAGGRGGAGGSTGAGGGAAGVGAGGSTPGSGGSGTGVAGSGISGSGGPGMGGLGGTSSSGSGGSAAGGNSTVGSGGNSSTGVGGNAGAGGTAPASGGGGCACAIADRTGTSMTLPTVLIGMVVLGARRRRARRAGVHRPCIGLWR